MKLLILFLLILSSYFIDAQNGHRNIHPFQIPHICVTCRPYEWSLASLTETEIATLSALTLDDCICPPVNKWGNDPKETFTPLGTGKAYCCNLDECCPIDTDKYCTGPMYAHFVRTDTGCEYKCRDTEITCANLTIFNEEQCQCECPHNPVRYCRRCEVFDYDTCQCIPKSSPCHDCEYPQEWNSLKSICECPSVSRCGDPAIFFWNPRKCKCECRQRERHCCPKLNFIWSNKVIK